MNALTKLPKINRHQARKVEQHSVLPNLMKITGIVPAMNGWGGVGPGRWTEARDTFNGKETTAGCCGRCGELTRAIDLELRYRADGTYYWACDDCRNGR